LLAPPAFAFALPAPPPFAFPLPAPPPFAFPPFPFPLFALPPFPLFPSGPGSSIESPPAGSCWTPVSAGGLAGSEVAGAGGTAAEGGDGRISAAGAEGGRLAETGATGAASLDEGPGTTARSAAATPDPGAKEADRTTGVNVPLDAGAPTATGGEAGRGWTDDEGTAWENTTPSAIADAAAIPVIALAVLPAPTTAAAEAVVAVVAVAVALAAVDTPAPLVALVALPPPSHPTIRAMRSVIRPTSPMAPGMGRPNMPRFR
jgi:hypothetical protein